MNDSNTSEEDYELGGDSTDSLKKRRRISYTNAQKEEAIAFLIDKRINGEAEDTAAACLLLNRVSGFEHVSIMNVRRWKDSGSKKPPGRKPNNEFEMDVIREVMASGSCSRDELPLDVCPNAAYSYAEFRLAAQKIQASAKWLAVEKVQKLSFSAKWIWGMLKRHEIKPIGFMPSKCPAEELHGN